ncbi:MAG: hypothetical protein ACE5EI_01350 [Thermodesulfobacteriota bacterium]
MKNVRTIILAAAVVVSVLVVFAVSYHSLEEIHYLKTFYPAEFSVEEAFYASAVELVKVFVIGVPFFVVIAASLYLLARGRDRD